MDVRTVTETSYSFKLSDVDSYLAFNNASPVTATVLPDLSGATPRLAQDSQTWSVGNTISVFQEGGGALTIAEGHRVTIRKPETLVLAKQYASATLIYRGNNVWDLAGYVTSA